MSATNFAGKYDYIVVGAGSAGCVLAKRLTEEHDLSVLLIEAGGKDDYFWIHVPVGYLYCIDNPRTDWRYRTEADSGLNGRSLIYPRGKVLGGSSSINGMIYMRGQARDYDEWAKLTGESSWAWGQVLPFFKKSEDHHQGGDALHGAGGEWRVEKQRLSWEILDAFRAAAGQTGIPCSDDFNRGDNEGCGYFEVNQKRGIRWNTARAFLNSGSRRGKLEIMTGCQVRRLKLEKGDGRLALQRCRIRRQRPALDCRGERGNHLDRRGYRLPANPGIVRHRSGRAVAAARDCGRRRFAGRRRKPARPLAVAHGVQDQGRQELEHDGQ